MINEVLKIYLVVLFTHVLSFSSFAKEYKFEKTAELQWRICKSNWKEILEKKGATITEKNSRFVYQFNDAENKMHDHKVRMRLRLNSKNELHYSLKQDFDIDGYQNLNFPNTNFLNNSENFDDCELDVTYLSKEKKPETKIECKVEVKLNKKKKNKVENESTSNRITFLKYKNVEKSDYSETRDFIIPDKIQAFWKHSTFRDSINFEKGFWNIEWPVETKEFELIIPKSKHFKSDIIFSLENSKFEKANFDRWEISTRVDYVDNSQYKKLFRKYTKLLSDIVDCGPSEEAFSKDNISDLVRNYKK